MLKIENLRDWEKIQKVVRRHWIIYFFLGLYLFLWIWVTTSLLAVFWSVWWVWLVLVIFWQIFIIFLYMEWVNHDLDVFVITDSRIIGLHQISFLNRSISECNLWQVQEVQAYTKWLLPNILNYWKLTIQTAWNASNFYMSYAPEVIKTSREINNLADDYKERSRKSDGTS